MLAKLVNFIGYIIELVQVCSTTSTSRCSTHATNPTNTGDAVHPVFVFGNGKYGGFDLFLMLLFNIFAPTVCDQLSRMHLVESCFSYSQSTIQLYLGPTHSVSLCSYLYQASRDYLVAYERKSESDDLFCVCM